MGRKRGELTVSLGAYPRAIFFLTLAVVFLQGAGRALAAGYGWAENAGWVNTQPASSPIQVVSNGASGYLAGYCWSENMGWIKLGDGTGPYANNHATNWGVNMDGSGNLSGYAWGENIGWINFNPGSSSVTCAITTATLSGYAWGENVGWIQFSTPATGLVTSGDSWHYWSSGAIPASNWTSRTYADGAWYTGPAPLGYNDNNIVTAVDDGGNPTNRWITYYFRKPFVVTNTAVVTGLTATFIADDGAVIYLNGNKIHTTTNMPVPATYSSLATPNVVEPYVPITFTINPSQLTNGTNVIAVEVHQAAPDSSDLYFDLALQTITTATTNQPGGGFSVDSSDTNTSWLAYNDLSWDSSQISNKITRLGWVDDADHDLTGRLVKYTDGSTNSVTLTFAGASGAGLWVTTNQGTPMAGTPGYTLFDGKVDMDRTIYCAAANTGTVTIAGMDPNRRYRLALLGNRGETSYTNRDTVVTLSGADLFTNASSSGASISGPASETTTIITGTNTGGLIFNYTGIAAGEDGTLLVTVSGGAGNPFSWYLNTMLLELLPTNAATYSDADSDGMDDSWETSYFGSTSATNGGMMTDADGDGSINYDEYRAGTDPTSAGSAFQFSGISPTNNTAAMVLRWASVAGKTYTVMQSTNLAAPWTTVQSAVPATAPLNVYTTSLGTNRLMWRIKVE